MKRFQSILSPILLVLSCAFLAGTVFSYLSRPTNKNLSQTGKIPKGFNQLIFSLKHEIDLLSLKKAQGDTITPSEIAMISDYIALLKGEQEELPEFSFKKEIIPPVQFTAMLSPKQKEELSLHHSILSTALMSDANDLIEATNSLSAYLITLINHFEKEQQLSSYPETFSPTVLFFILTILSGGTAVLILIVQQYRKLRLSKQQAEKFVAEAYEANRAKSAFLASMSHEIRTPMNGVIGMTSLLLNSSLNSEQKHYAEVIQTSGENLLTIVNDILDFSKIEAGKLKIEKVPFELPTLIEDTMDIIAYKCSAKSIELINKMSSHLPFEVESDPVRIRQIILNLAGNAVKFTEHGEVIVTSEVTADKTGQSFLKCSVKDTGIGIPKERLDTLFQPFSQAEQSTTRRFGGSGLGLSISKQLTEIMGGEIGVESIPKEGSTFWFTLPLTIKKDGDPNKLIPIPKDLNVLIVDDNNSCREYLSSLLTSWNIPSSAASNLPEALSTINSSLNTYTTTLIDIDLNGKSGTTIAQALQNSLPEDAKQIIMARIDTKETADVTEFESYDLISKPIRHHQLLEILCTKGAIRSHGQNKADNFHKKSCSIMVVEDNLTNQEVAKAVFSALGYSITIANNGKEAIDILSDGDFDLVFMDCQMPEMDGFETTAAIRAGMAGNDKKNTPIIAMTAHAMQGDRARCIDAGMDGYIPKPITRNNIDSILATHLPEGDYSEDKSQPIPSTPESPKPDAICLTSTPISDSSKIDKEEENDSWASLPVFNRDDLIKRFAGDDSILSIIIPAFLEDTERLMGELAEAIQNEDSDKVSKLSHSMKGASANVSGEAFSAKALELELAGKADEKEKFPQIHCDLVKEYERLKEVLKEAK